MKSPILILQDWLKDERANSNPFPQGAVLCTISEQGHARSRVVGTMIDTNNNVRFHTSPNSRKVTDIEFNNRVSLCYSFQHSLRSFSIEGTVSLLDKTELAHDWMKFDSHFRRQYRVFGAISGNEIGDLQALKTRGDNLIKTEDNSAPMSFIGYKFLEINRVSTYSVNYKEFAISILYEHDSKKDIWLERQIVP